EGGDIVVITTPDGWWWLIPFSDGTVSVGIVMPSRRFKERTGTVEQLFDGCVASTPEVKDLLEGNRRLGEIRAIPDYSYTTARFSSGSSRGWGGGDRSSGRRASSTPGRQRPEENVKDPGDSLSRRVPSRTFGGHEGPPRQARPRQRAVRPGTLLPGRAA